MDKLQLMGDPHLGRKFRTGVPLHRVGDREKMVWRDFRRNLMDHDADLHICMGDLFDKHVVPPEVVLKAVSIYREASTKLAGCGFIVIRGNHDVSRDTSKKSSFDLFTLLVEDLPNVTVIDEVSVIGDYGFVPFCPFTTAQDQVRKLSHDLDTVFMHHDFTDFGGEHVIPTEMLAEMGILNVINGHDHLARTEKRHGVTVTMTGSLQPFTHAEDDTGDWYVTTGLPIEGDVTNKNVRVLLKDGETLPDDLDCLSLTAKREAAENLEVDTSDFDSLDLGQMLERALGESSVSKILMEAFRNAE